MAQDTMPEELRLLYTQVLENFAYVRRALQSMQAELRSSGDMVWLTNVAYALRQAEEVAEGTRKELTKAKELAEKMACYLHTTAASDEPIRTSYVTATPSVKQAVKVPSRKSDPAGYANMMHSLGIPEQLWSGEREHAAIAIHWPGLCEFLQTRQAQGLPALQGLDTNTATAFSLKMRAKKGVLE